MALHTELPIHRTGVRLLTLAVKVQEQMPRSVKRILGDKVTQHCVDMLDLMALANASRHEARHAYIERLLQSKKMANHMHAMSFYFMVYNFVKVHKSIRTTPGMEAGVTDFLWSMEDIVMMSETI